MNGIFGIFGNVGFWEFCFGGCVDVVEMIKKLYEWILSSHFSSLTIPHLPKIHEIFKSKTQKSNSKLKRNLPLSSFLRFLFSLSFNLPLSPLSSFSRICIYVLT